MHIKLYNATFTSIISDWYCIENLCLQITKWKYYAKTYYIFYMKTILFYSNGTI